MHSTRKRLRNISWLMLASELLLLLFVAEWMRMRYREEEQQLHRNIAQLFTLTETRFADSMANKMVDSLLRNTIADKPQISLRIHSTKPGGEGKMTEVAHAMIRNLNDSRSRRLKHAIPETQMVMNRQQVSLNGVPMDQSSSLPVSTDVQRMLRITLMRFREQDSTLMRFEIATDTAGFSQAFTTALQQQQPGLRSISVPAGDTGLFVYQSESMPVAFAVEGFRPFLVRSLWQQLLFSAVLLLLTSLAFWLAYRNMRQQALFARQKDNFISNVSHELKTPVATTKVALEALSTYNALEDPARARKYLEVARWEMERLETMIGKVMNILQTEHGQLQLQRELLSPAAIMEALVRTLQPIIAAKQGTVRMEALDGSLKVWADKAHLVSALYNLLDNALKYGNGRIQVQVDAVQGNALLRISDNGPGVPPAYREKIFDKFFRISEGNRHDVKGYGLGLSYARYIAVAHGGDLQLDSSYTSGASFVLRLPLPLTS